MEWLGVLTSKAQTPSNGFHSCGNRGKDSGQAEGRFSIILEHHPGESYTIIIANENKKLNYSSAFLVGTMHVGCQRRSERVSPQSHRPAGLLATLHHSWPLSSFTLRRHAFRSSLTTTWWAQCMTHLPHECESVHRQCVGARPHGEWQPPRIRRRSGHDASRSVQGSMGRGHCRLRCGSHGIRRAAHGSCADHDSFCANEDVPGLSPPLPHLLFVVTLACVGSLCGDARSSASRARAGPVHPGGLVVARSRTSMWDRDD